AFSPGNPKSGKGVDRSLPLALENWRKASVITAHTVWLPTSSALVSQQPLRKKPVTGASEQDCNGSPNTLREGRGPRPNSLGSMDMRARASPSRPQPGPHSL